MWKKALAIVSIPVAALLTFATVNATKVTVAEGMDRDGGYQAGYFIGMAMAMFFTGGVLFFWWRWIWRVLFRRPSQGTQ